MITLCGGSKKLYMKGIMTSFQIKNVIVYNADETADDQNL